ncbi:MAG: DUF4065 domain-containing protein [Planctomycetota bacterium]|nr:DUF4065 domain-containing protein [Planctomycetota bacterium]
MVTGQQRRRPTTAADVAAYILEKCGSVTHMKLQKLLYYSQAWSLVWDDRPMFRQRIEAWVNGPVVRDIYRKLRTVYQVDSVDSGQAENLTDDQRETVDAVLSHYGKRSSQWLSDLTHMEDPWRESRAKLAPHERGTAEITHASMAEYYSGL